MKTLYLECMSGISGDMTVAALLDLGADEAVLREGLASLQVQGYRLAVGRVNKSGIDACDFDVILEGESGRDHGGCGHHHHGEEAEPHDHPHGHGNGHGHSHGEEYSHTHVHNEHHDHHGHSHGHGDGHVHRNVLDINQIIDGSAITPRAKEMAKRIFAVVARAEAKVHGKPLEEVHFHEVGAVDSIVDIVGAAICMDNLGVERILCSPLREGTGTLRCQHGVMPVPAPATLEISRSCGIPLVITDNQGEMVTPTGAAIVGALAESFGPPGEMLVERIGYGAGKREYKTANVLRAMLLQDEEQNPAHDSVVKLECNLDDMTGEELAWACSRLMEGGALDVWCTPIQMKKSRPAQMLSVLVRPEQEEALIRLLFIHTTTIGLRRSIHTRRVMTRREKEVQTAFGPVRIKESRYQEICKQKVEFEHARELAEQNNVAVKQITTAAYTELNRNMKDTK